MRRRDGVKEKKSSVSLHTEVVFSISGFEGFRRRETEGGREREGWRKREIQSPRYRSLEWKDTHLPRFTHAHHEYLYLRTF